MISELPWKIIKLNRDCDIQSSDKSKFVDGGYDYVALDVDSENAKFIVEACNNYEKLQQINKELINELEDIYEWWSQGILNGATLSYLEKVIARAKEG